jgi:hypothetical protein
VVGDDGRVAGVLSVELLVAVLGRPPGEGAAGAVERAS